jgi:amino acid adenylation domain-containing protein
MADGENRGRRSRLSPAREALLSQRLSAGIQKLGSGGTIPPRTGGGPAPLSFAQQRIWFLDRVRPASSFYNIADAVLLSGALDVDALEWSLGEIARRHETLRTRFGNAAGDLAPEVLPPEPFLLERRDLSTLPEAERREAAHLLATTEIRRPFDILRDRLFRGTLVRLKPDEHVLVLALHHLVGDGWSMGVLVRELAHLYGGHVRGDRPPLPPLPIQYGDFAAWQRTQVESEAWRRQLEYWRRKLAPPLPALELPLDRPRPPTPTFRGARLAVTFPRALVGAVQSFGAGVNATPFMVMLAAWKAVLHRYTGQDDLVVGSPIANRNLVELEPLIGFFVNSFALRTDLSGDPTFSELVARVRQTALDAYANQDFPFDRLVEELQPQRVLIQNPIFQTVFAFQNAPIPPLELPGLTLRVLDVHDGTAKFDLLCTVVERSGEYEVALEYNTDLYGPERMARMLEHYRTLLEDAVRRPGARISALRLMLPAEERRLLVEWSGRDVAWDPPSCLHEIFEAQVARTPDRVAVVHGPRRLTYAELETRANQLAHHLRGLGVGPETPVGIGTGRRVETAVAVLGVLKAGGTFVPLDPRYPRDRLAYILSDTQPRVALATGEAAGAFEGVQVLRLDDDWAAIAASPGARLPREVGPDHVAYIVYTSGSTGRPKGIAMRHRPVSNLIAWHASITAIPDGGRTLQFASLNFDVSFQELFGTWRLGGEVHFIDEEERRDPRALLRFLRQHRIQRLFTPMVMLQALAEAAGDAGAEPPEWLREVFAGGEPLQISREVDALFRRIDCALHNHYGPSECHVVTDNTLLPPPDGWPARPPIGLPIPNLRLYVLDRHGRPLPTGIPGELYVGGDVQARGYWNRPGVTAERYVPDPFGGGSGTRLYRTGDLVRWLENGQLEFLGRLDHQVKIRGFLVDPVEVQAVLDQNRAIRDSVVIADGAGGGRRLIAYFVPATDPPPSADELRSFLKARLPDYMIPSAFAALPVLPVDPNGKVDRKALPPVSSLDPAGRERVAPRTESERMLCEIWREVLRAEHVGVEDNFFDAGGHSLLLLQVQTQIRQLRGREVSVVDLFRYPTVAALARYLDEEGGPGEDVEARVSTRLASAGRQAELRKSLRSPESEED